MAAVFKSNAIHTLESFGLDIPSGMSRLFDDGSPGGVQTAGLQSKICRILSVKYAVNLELINPFVDDCLENPPAFDSLRSATLFEGKIREALHRLKYNRDIGLGEVLAPHLVDVYQKQNWNVDMVTSVPLSHKRLRMRGYNQAEMLAKPFAGIISKPYSNHIVQRVIDTRSQIDLIS